MIGLSTFFGRLPMFFVYMPFREFHLKICYQVISETLFLTNITWNFFIYYFFNKSFKLVFHSYLFKIRDYCRDSDHHTNNNRHNLHQNLTTTNINLTTDRLPLSNSKEAVLWILLRFLFKQLPIIVIGASQLFSLNVWPFFPGEHSFIKNSWIS